MKKIYPVVSPYVAKLCSGVKKQPVVYLHAKLDNVEVPFLYRVAVYFLEWSNLCNIILCQIQVYYQYNVIHCNVKTVITNAELSSHRKSVST